MHAQLLPGGWFMEQRAGAMRAVQLESGFTVELDGDPNAWSSAGGAFALRAAGGPLADLGQAMSEAPSARPTLGNLLGHAGWGLLFLELTGRCNERCLHCYASSSPDVETELELPQILDILADARSLGFHTVQLTGGDPLISRHLRAAVQAAFDLGFPTLEVYTNGLAFTRALAEFFAERRVQMAFSLYSHRPEVHDAITATSASHRRTLRAIRYAVEAGIEVRVSVILRSENANDTGAVRKLVESLGVRPGQVRVDRERPVGRGHWEESAPLPNDEMSGAHGQVESESAGAKLSVSYDGQVVPCIFDRRIVFGSTTNRRLAAILDAELRVKASSGSAVSLPVLGEPLACGDCRTRHAILSQLEWSTT